MTRPCLVSWSGGKDSAAALEVLLAPGSGWEVVGLVTTLNGESDRVAIHGVRRGLLRRQADRLGLPLLEIDLPDPCTNADYERLWEAGLRTEVARGIRHCAFGDLFLEDIRAYRERLSRRIGMEPLFPIWGRDTRELAGDLIGRGYRSVVCSVQATLGREYVGRWWDAAFLADLPVTADPCGENGEFHTLVVDAPHFREPISVVRGAIVERAGMWFQDLMTAAEPVKTDSLFPHRQTPATPNVSL